MDTKASHLGLAVTDKSDTKKVAIAQILKLSSLKRSPDAAECRDADLDSTSFAMAWSVAVFAMPVSISLVATK
jgi:hypothetical protein